MFLALCCVGPPVGLKFVKKMFLFIQNELFYEFQALGKLKELWEGSRRYQTQIQQKLAELVSFCEWTKKEIC